MIDCWFIIIISKNDDMQKEENYYVYEPNLKIRFYKT